MNKAAWLVVGSAIPEGPATYVLTQEESQYLLWNPKSGQNDTFCPLQTVGSLGSSGNLWLNIQKHTSPMRINFDITKGNLWKPLSSPNFLYPGLLGTQLDRLDYQPPDEAAAAELQRRIEKTLKDKFMEWRPHRLTHWNRYCTGILKEFLPRLDLGEGRGTAERHCQELQKLLGDMRISGFPLHQPFSNMERIAKAVRSTRAQNIQAANAEFTLAVHEHPYPNNVLLMYA